MVGETDDISVRRLEFDSWNEAHLAEHRVTKEDIQAVLRNSPRFFRDLPRRSATHVMIGANDAGRFFYVALGPTMDGDVWYPVTGWPLTRQRATRLLGDEGLEDRRGKL